MGARLNLDGGIFTLDWGTRPPYNLSTGYYSNHSRVGIENTRLEAKDTKKTRGEGQGPPFQGQTLSRPRTGRSRSRPRTKHTNASVFQKKGLQIFFSGVLQKKKIFTKNFRAISKKEKVSKNFFLAFSKKSSVEKNFSADLQNFNHSKIVLSSSRGQGNFRGLEASRPRTRPSRTRLRTSKCVFEAKDVLEDSISESQVLFRHSALKLK